MNAEILNTLWEHKYRPKTLDDIILKEETKDKIKKYMKDGIIDNLFFCSKPGQGKTSLAKLISTLFDVDTQYINCSDENNVETVRNKVTSFANSMSSNGKFKLIILDEADGFANVQSQKILRVLMEEVADNTRFIITANYRDRIIEPLRSRCNELDITPDIESVGKRIMYILKNEGVKIIKDEIPNLSGLIRHYFPDVRSVIKKVQNCVDSNNEFHGKNVGASTDLINKIYDLITDGTSKATELRKLLIESEKVFSHDYGRLLVDFYHSIITRDSIDPQTKSKWAVILAEYAYRSGTVIDQELNASACFFSLMSK